MAKKEDPSMADKIEEEIEKAQSRRNVIKNDLKEHGATLSAVSQVVLISEMASIDAVIQEMNKDLEEMGWQEFIEAAWRDAEPF
jgi:chromosome condensin MukBEF ATPase and DNA-binding subunit MukB